MADKTKEKRGTGGTGWVGEEDLTRALKALEGQRIADGSSATLVQKATQTALKYHAEYKMVVFEVEGYIRRASAADRLGGLYVIDSICRHSKGKDKENFCGRFSTRMQKICSSLQEIPATDKVAFGRILEDWKKRKLFSAETFSDIDGSGAASSASSSSTSSTSSSSFSSSSSQSANSLESGLTVTDDTATVINQLPAHKKKTEKRKIKICPFRDGNCPFGDKCRFAHDQNSTWQENVSRRTKKPFQASAQEGRVFGSKEKRLLPTTKELLALGFALASYPTSVKTDSVDAPAAKRFSRGKVTCEAPIAGSATLHLTSKDLWSQFPVK